MLRKQRYASAYRVLQVTQCIKNDDLNRVRSEALEETTEEVKPPPIEVADIFLAVGRDFIGLYEAFGIHVHLRSSKPEGNPGSLYEEVRNVVCTVWKYRPQPDATVVLRPCLTDMREITIMGSDDEWEITNAVIGCYNVILQTRYVVWKFGLVFEFRFDF